MKVAIVAGGGGHFAVCLSVIEALPKGTEVLLLGRKHSLEGDSAISLEYRVAQERNIPFVSLQAGRLQRKFTKHTMSALAKTPRGMLQAYKALRSYRPDVVFSAGGYVSLPVVFAAWTLGIPVVIHEQVMGAGLANRLAARFAKTICISWESSTRYFPKEKVLLTGNPIRKDFAKVHATSRKKDVLYITGGSLGAHAINLLIEPIISDLLTNYTVYHQTGDSQQYKDYERLQRQKETLPKAKQERYILERFFPPDEIPRLMQTATLVICRAGINTITELMYTGTRAIIIPLPFSQQHEQQKNAVSYEKLGMAMVLHQLTATSKALLEAIQTLMAKPEDKALALKAQQLVTPDASARIVEAIVDAVR